jgi:hypothetical protein
MFSNCFVERYAQRPNFYRKSSVHVARRDGLGNLGAVHIYSKKQAKKHSKKPGGAVAG